MNTLKIVGLSLLGLVVIIALNFAFGWVDVGYTKTVGKAKENARREVFEQSQSYVEGKRQELTKYRLEYQRTKDSTEKEAIRQTILQSFANFDEKKLPYDLLQFLQDIKR